MLSTKSKNRFNLLPPELINELVIWLDDKSSLSFFFTNKFINHSLSSGFLKKALFNGYSKNYLTEIKHLSPHSSTLQTLTAKHIEKDVMLWIPFFPIHLVLRECPFTYLDPPVITNVVRLYISFISQTQATINWSKFPKVKELILENCDITNLKDAKQVGTIRIFSPTQLSHITEYFLNF